MVDQRDPAIRSLPNAFILGHSFVRRFYVFSDHELSTLPQRLFYKVNMLGRNLFVNFLPNAGMFWHVTWSTEAEAHLKASKVCDR